jgi:bifunctional non-homologous end joining protein LigD
VPATRATVARAISKLRIGECPFVNLPEKKGAHRMDRQKMEEVKWVRPKVIAEIAFHEFTTSGYLRHSEFLRLRDRTDAR